MITSGIAVTLSRSPRVDETGRRRTVGRRRRRSKALAQGLHVGPIDVIGIGKVVVADLASGGLAVDRSPRDQAGAGEELGFVHGVLFVQPIRHSLEALPS